MKRKPADEPVDLGAELRSVLTEDMRRRCERTPDRVGPYRSPWPLLLARLEAGEPVQLFGYQLPAWARVDGDPFGMVQVRSDGSVVAVPWLSE